MDDEGSFFKEYWAFLVAIVLTRDNIALISQELSIKHGKKITLTHGKI